MKLLSNYSRPFLSGVLLLVLAQACTTNTGSSDVTDLATLEDSPSVDTSVVYKPGIISTPEHDEGGLLLTGYGETYFWRRKPGEKQKIYVLDPRLTTESGSEAAGTRPVAQSPSVAAFSTDRDENPFLTKDGLTLYFASERPISGRPNRGNFDMNIWVTHRDSIGGAWEDPEPLPPSFNLVQAEGEEWPTANINSVFSLDDQTFYVSTQMPGDTALRIYSYQRDASDNLVNPVRIEGLFDDPKYSTSGGHLTPDGKYLLFNSYGAPGGEGGEDIYVSRNEGNGKWSTAVPLTSINTEHEEAGPYVFEENLYFGKSRVIDAKNWEYDVWDIHVVPLAELDLESLFQ